MAGTVIPCTLEATSSIPFVDWAADGKSRLMAPQGAAESYSTLHRLGRNRTGLYLETIADIRESQVDGRPVLGHAALLPQRRLACTC
jgi:hypothetical protein